LHFSQIRLTLARTFIINRGQPTAPHKDRDTTGSPEV
jgi:hypothetical protein